MHKIKDQMLEIITKLLHYMMAQINQNKIIIKPHLYMIIKITNNKIKEWHNNNIKKSNLNNKISNSHYIILASFNNKAKNNSKPPNFIQKNTNRRHNKHLVARCMISQNKTNIKLHSYIKMILNSLHRLIKLLNIQIASKNNLIKLLLFIQMICSTHLNNNLSKDFKLPNYIQIRTNNRLKLNNNNSKLHLFTRMIIDRHLHNLILIRPNISLHNIINKILIIKLELINIKPVVN